MKLNRTVMSIFKNGRLKKCLRIMKLTSFLVLFFTLQMSASVWSQTMSVKLKNSTLQELFIQIEKSSTYRFFYNNDEVDVYQRISVDAEEKTVGKILEAAFAGLPYSFRELENKLILIERIGAKPNPIGTSMQQQKTVSGKVTDSSGASVPGVSVVIKGTTNGTITDANGNYSLTNVPGNAIVQFSFVGMKGQEVEVGTKTTINIILAEDAIGIEEVVAIGYGKIKKTELTSAVTSIKSEDFVRGAVRDAAQLIQGKVAGLNIIQTNANPVGESQISMRGITTLKSGTSPLIIIDGVPGSLSTVAPEDIESIDVLKDGSAAAIYGTRGTNGVILITTRKVKGDTKETIEIDSYISTQIISKKLDFMDAKQYRELVAQKKPGAMDYGGNTYWLDQVLQTPVSTVNNISLRGGKNNSNYIINVNHKSLEGIMKKSDNDVLTTRLEANHSMFDGKLRINANLLGLEKKYYSGSNGSSFRDDVYRNALTYNPTDPVKDPNGIWTEHIVMNNYSNPVALLEETKGEIDETNLKTFGTISFQPVDNLNVKLLLSRNKYNSVSGYSETKKHISNFLSNRNGFASRETFYKQDDLSEFTVQYNKSIKSHHFNLLAGYSWQKNIMENYYMQNYDFPSDDYSYNNMGAGLALSKGLASISSNKIETKLIGYFFRLNYNYKDKYLLMASIRHEGSTKFGVDHKWGDFPAISAGWNLKNESFLENATWINTLKIRTGFGVTGTEPSSPYMSLSRLIFSRNALMNGSWIPTIMPSTNPNPELRWEKKEETNIGIDFSILKNRISGAFDVYKRTTKDMLWDYNVPKPPYLYNTIVANAGIMENMGYELHLEAMVLKKRDFDWVSTVNYSTNKNKLVSLSNEKFKLQSGYFYTGNLTEPIQQTSHIVQEGETIGNFYGYKTIDIDGDGRWVIEDQDGNPKSILEQTPKDKKIIGNGIPKHILSWDNSFVYKKFDLNVTMRGAFDYQILNGSRLYYDVPVMLTRGNVLSTAFDDKYGKRPLNDQQSLNYVSYFIENGDFWKIDNLTFGYNSSLNSGLIKQFRLYFSCLNLATITNYSGIDPEVNVLGLSPGIDDRDRYPSARTYSFGIKITF